MFAVKFKAQNKCLEARFVYSHPAKLAQNIAYSLFAVCVFMKKTFAAGDHDPEAS